MDEGYRPVEYWTRRLGDDFSLRGTGHLSYSVGYNAWLYRGKRRALRRALGTLAPGTRALDVGSGVGWVVAQLCERGAEVEGCDLTEVAVRGLRARFGGPPDRFFVVELGRDPVPRPDGRYDLVTALDVMYHLTDDRSWGRALAELARVLRPGGRLVVTDRFGEDAVAGVPRGGERPAAHVRFRDEAAWTREAAEVGLGIEAIRPCYRWLSRDRSEPSRLSRLPDAARGAVEFALEHVPSRPAHLRCSVLVRLP
ncbi:MAG: class I SAM-dependent methyltransferase [Acidimicrobiales bacterium]